MTVTGIAKREESGAEWLGRDGRAARGRQQVRKGGARAEGGDMGGAVGGDGGGGDESGGSDGGHQEDGVTVADILNETEEQKQAGRIKYQHDLSSSAALEIEDGGLEVRLACV